MRWFLFLFATTAFASEEYTYSVVYPGFPVCDTCATLPAGHYCAGVNSAGGCIDVKPVPTQCKTIAPQNQHLFECKVHNGSCCTVVGIKNTPQDAYGNFTEVTHETETDTQCNPILASDAAEAEARAAMASKWPYDWEVTSCWEVGPGPYGVNGAYGYGWYQLTHDCEKWTNPNPGLSNIGAEWTKAVRCRGER